MAEQVGPFLSTLRAACPSSSWQSGCDCCGDGTGCSLHTAPLPQVGWLELSL